MLATIKSLSRSSKGYARIRSAKIGEKLPQLVYHYFIQVDSSGNKLAFSIHFNPNNFNDKISLDDCINNLVKSPTSHLHRIVASINPLNISVDVPAMIVLELDNSTNWRFQKGKRGITVPSQPKGDYCKLVHVAREKKDDGSYARVDRNNYTPDDIDCRILFFATQTPPPRDDPGDPFNLFVEILHGMEGKEEKLLPLIIDPDIKDSGPPKPTPVGRRR